MCPDCKTRIHCGSVGLANLEKNHRGKKICVKAKEKREKEEQAAKRPNLLNFFTRPKAASVPLTISRSTPIHGRTMAQPGEKAVPAAVIKQKDPNGQSVHIAAPVVTDFLETLHHLIKNLPDTVPEASDYDKLAVFEGNPMQFDDPTLDADELWENVLNAQLKSVLGWGMEGDMDLVIRRGRKGLDGLENFVKYFIVKRGVNPSLFEGKLSHLMIALQKK